MLFKPKSGYCSNCQKIIEEHERMRKREEEQRKQEEEEERRRQEELCKENRIIAKNLWTIF